MLNNLFRPFSIERKIQNEKEELAYISKKQNVTITVMAIITTSTSYGNKQSNLVIYSKDKLLNEDTVIYEGKKYVINNITYINDYEDTNSLSHYKGELK